MLDLGCETGIATRSLERLGFSNITGCDVDHDMLAEAKKHDANFIDYVCSPADSMPFANQSFDVITNFGAFHWFCDEKSIAEIKRVLKNSGLFFINKNGTSLTKHGFKLVKEQSLVDGHYRRPLKISIAQGNK